MCRVVKPLALLVSLFFFQSLSAQDPTLREMQAKGMKKYESLDSNGWKAAGTLLMNLNQGTLSNWVAGGEESVLGINGLVNYNTHYRKDEMVWDNFLELALGFQNASSFKKFRKIDDRLDITSKYTRQFAKHWYWGALGNFFTQLLPGYDYSTEPETRISGFMTPGRVLFSPGIEYKPSTRFMLFLSPVTARWIFKKDPEFRNLSKFGVDSGKTVNNELGAFLSARSVLELTRWARYTGRVDLFSNYRRDPQNVDLLMNNLLTLTFNKWLATNLSLDMIYDHDALGRLQVKEVLGIGLTLKF